MFRPWSYRRKLKTAAAAQERMPTLSDGGKVELPVPFIDHLSNVLSDYSNWLHEQACLAEGIDPRRLFGYQNLEPEVSYSLASDVWKALLWGAENITERHLREKCIWTIVHALTPNRIFESQVRDEGPERLQDLNSTVRYEQILKRWHDLSSSRGVVSKEDIENLFVNVVLSVRRGEKSTIYLNSEFFDLDDWQIHRGTSKRLVHHLARQSPDVASDALTWIFRPDIERTQHITYLKEQGRNDIEVDNDLNSWQQLKFSDDETRLMIDALTRIIRSRGLVIDWHDVEEGDVKCIARPLIDTVSDLAQLHSVVQTIVDVFRDRHKRSTYRDLALCQTLRLLFSASASKMSADELTFLANLPDVDCGIEDPHRLAKHVDNQDIREFATAELNRRGQGALDECRYSRL